MYEELVKKGFSQAHLRHALENNISAQAIARIVSSSHEVFKILTAESHCQAKLSGKLRFNAESALDIPVTGDWVEIVRLPDEEALIKSVFPRSSFLARSAVGRRDQQILAANIDTAIVVMAAGRDFNLSRTDRYLALIQDQGILPVIFINKADLVSEDELKSMERELYRRHPTITLFTGCAINGQGLSELVDSISAGQSFCVVGSSGVGKSSLINFIVSAEVEKVSEIGHGTGRGRHTTTTGCLHLTRQGAILIDTPGLREVGMTDAENGINATFSEIEELTSNCRFTDCTHDSEPGCAVQEALVQGIISEEKLLSYLKLKREASRFGQTIAEKRRKDKGFGKMVRQVKKFKKENSLIR